MNFGYDFLVGISAAFLTTLSFIPQIIKAYHAHSGNGIKITRV
jgi:uncharacterized protein with PQ loop repeat